MSNIMNDSLALQMKALNGPIPAVKQGDYIGFGLTAGPQPTKADSGTLAPTYTSGTTGNAAYNNYVGQSFDTQINGLNDILNTLQPAQNAAQLQAQNQFQNQRNSLDSQHATGQSQLGFAQNQVDTQKARSLSDIQHQLMNSLQSYNNQLGAYGAGDSSAAGLIQRALGGLGSRNRSDVMHSADDQTQQIGIKKNALEDNYSNGLKQLDDWKTSTFNDIANNYAQQKLALQQQIAGAQGQKAQYLASIGQQLDQSVLDGLANLQNQYKSYADTLNRNYSNFNTPNVAIDPSLQQFAVQPISAGQLGQLNTSTLQRQNTGSDAQAFLNNKLKDQFNLGF